MEGFKGETHQGASYLGQGKEKDGFEELGGLCPTLRSASAPLSAGEPVCSHRSYLSLPSPSSLQKAPWPVSQAAGQEGFLLALCCCLGLGSCSLSFQMNPIAKKPIDKSIGFGSGGSFEPGLAKLRRSRHA